MYIPVRAYILIYIGRLHLDGCALPAAGLLTFPSLLYLPEYSQWRYTSRPLKWGLQLQVQSRTLTGFPYIKAASAARLPFVGAKVRISEGKTKEKRVFL